MNIYDFSVLDNKGELVKLDKYKDKVIIIVNTATKCGLTPQYDALEALYEKYHNQGFEILDFPSNQFKEQAPESDEQINEFCTLKFNTKFDRFKKIDVNGQDAEPLYVYLKQVQPHAKGKSMMDSLTKFINKKENENDISWNFEKFLINKNGEVVERFTPGTKPEKIEASIKALL